MHPKIEAFLHTTLHKLKPDGCPIPHTRLQSLLSKVATRLTPAFHDSPWMEWEYGTWVGAFAGYDEVGRQLGEANVLPEWRATPLDDHWRPFKGPGIRNGHPFNVDAMHEMVNCWDDLLIDAATLRDWYCRQQQRDPAVRLSASDLYLITTIAVSISSFLLRRGDKPTRDGALPRQAAAAFKVIGGMYAATNRMFSQANPMLLQPELDVEAFLQYLEDEHLLLSPEMRACAGPVKMIRQILSAAIDPPPANTALDGFAYLGADRERAFAYGLQCARIDLGVLLHSRSLGYYLGSLLTASDTPGQVRSMLMQENELGFADEIQLQAYITVARHLLPRFPDPQPEQTLLDALPASSANVIPVSDPGLIGATCYRLEQAVRVFFDTQQTVLDELLQRPPQPRGKDGWSPAPGSQFLKELFDAYPPLAASL